MLPKTGMAALAWFGGLFALAVLGGAPAAVHAEMLRIEDESGAVHYTNNPCHPRYRRLVPGACRPPEPVAGVAPAPAVAPGVGPAPPYAREIEQTAGRYGLDHRLVQAVVQVESAGNPRAVSPKGAQGLMQLMPARARSLGVRDSFDPGANLDGGVRHLRDLLDRYAGDLMLALAAYNAGEEAVRLHGGVPPYRETQEYVRKVLAIYGPASGPAGQKPTKPAPGRGTPARRL